MVIGAAAIMSANVANGTATSTGSGTSSSASGSGSSGLTGATNVGGMVLGLHAEGLKPSTSYRIIMSSNACSASGSTSGSGSRGSGSGGSGSSGSGSGTSGSSGSGGFATSTLRSDSMGDASIVTVLTGTPSMTSMAPGLQLGLVPASGGAVVTCSSIHRPTKILQLNAAGHGRVRGLALITTKVPVLAGAVKSGTEVIVYATGLTPRLSAPNHIHAGLCGASSPVLFPLATLVADAHGRAIAGTGIPYAVNLTTGSVRIHNADFSLASCGNLKSATAGMTGGAGTTGSGSSGSGTGASPTASPTKTR